MGRIAGSHWGRAAVAVVVGLLTFAAAVAGRPAYRETTLELRWPHFPAGGDVLLNWDTGRGFTSIEWQRSAPDGAATDLRLPERPVHRVRVRAYHWADDPPAPPAIEWAIATGKRARLDAGPAETSSRPAGPFTAARFNGATSHVRFDGPLVPGADAEFTVAVWFRPAPGRPRRQQLLSQWTAADPYNGFTLGWSANGLWHISDTWQTIPAGPVRPNRWHHVVLTCRRGDACLYLDGAAVARNTVARFTRGGSLVLGRQGELKGEYFAGLLGPIDYFPRAMSADDVDALFRGPVAGAGGEVRCHADDPPTRLTGRRPAVTDVPADAADLPRVTEQTVDLPAERARTRGSRMPRIAAGCLGVLVGTAAWFALGGRLHPRRWPAGARAFAGYFAAATVPSAVLLAVLYPGIWNNDTLYCWQAAVGGWKTDIHPPVYYLHIGMLLLVWDDPAAVPAFQTVVLGAVFAGVLTYARRAGANPWLLAGLAGLSGTTPAVVVYNCYPQKDVLFSALMLVWAAVLFRLYRERAAGRTVRPGPAAAAGLGLLLALLGTVRYNGAPYLVLIPLAIAGLRLLPWRPLAVLALSAAGGFYLLQFQLPRELRVMKESPYFHRLMAMTNPLAALVGDQVGRESLSPDELQTIERVLGKSADHIRHDYHLEDANGLFYAPGVRIWMPPEEWAAVNRIYVRRLVLDNPHVFAADRTGMFVNTVLCPRYTTFDHVAEEQVLRGQLRRTGWALAADSAWPAAVPTTRAGLACLDRHKMIFWNSGPALLLAVVAAARFRRYPGTALAASVIVFQAVLIFAACPMSYFKHVHFLYVAPFVLIPLWLVERRMLKDRAFLVANAGTAC